MDLLQNPFHILGANARDNRKRILELADERSLRLDATQCAQARSELTNPRKRLRAEVAWLPGFAPKRIEQVLTLLESSPANLLVADKLSPIARANLLAAALVRMKLDVTSASNWIRKLAEALEAVEPEALSAILNEDRVVSGFPEVTDVSAVETEIEEQRRYYRSVIKSALDNLPPRQLIQVMSTTVEAATLDGKEQGPVLINDLVDLYEVEAQAFLGKEEENIKELVEKLRAGADAKWYDRQLAPVTEQLIGVVRNWESVARPIQLNAKSRGLNHKASERIASMVRELSIHLFNDHDRLALAQQLTGTLQQLFANVDKVAERSAEDVETLEEIAQRRIRQGQNALVGAQSDINYEVNLGWLFNEKLRISPDRIEWKGRRWSLDSITRVRWGGTRHSTGVTYTVFFGSSTSATTIALRKQSTYSDIVGHLWRAVGLRLIQKYLTGLQAGQTYGFGSAVLHDHGMELKRKKLFGRNERTFYRWPALVTWSSDGAFHIAPNDERWRGVTLSYQDNDNIHVLETVLSAFQEHGGDRLSTLLGN
jgi:hypothetical protein